MPFQTTTDETITKILTKKLSLGDPAGSSIEPCSSTFRGPFPESESETRHIARFIKGNSDVIKAVISVHSYAQMILYPFNFALGKYPKNNDEQVGWPRVNNKALGPKMLDLTEQNRGQHE